MNLAERGQDLGKGILHRDPWAGKLLIKVITGSKVPRFLFNSIQHPPTRVPEPHACAVLPLLTGGCPALAQVAARNKLSAFPKAFPSLSPRYHLFLLFIAHKIAIQFVTLPCTTLGLQQHLPYHYVNFQVPIPLASVRLTSKSRKYASNC